MRILYFSRSYSTHDHRFLSAMANCGHELYALHLERHSHPLEDRPLPPQVELVQWAGGQKTARLADGPALLFDLKRVLRKLQPDIVQAGPLQTAALLVALAGYRPLVSMSWGYDLLLDPRRGPSWRWATRYTLAHSAAMVGDCATIRKLAISYGMPDERIITFPWGVDLKHYSAGTSEHSTAGTFTILSTRGWEPLYGVDVIARAFAQAASSRPEMRLVMLGNGSQAGPLRQIFTQAGVLDQVVFPGQVSQAELPRYYRMADLYVSASHSDGTSISLLEAMACGRPALVSDIPGNREWVTPGENGWWFPDGDANALAQALINACERRSSLPEMGKSARRLAEQRADWEKNYPALSKAYEIALNHAK